MYIGLFWLAFGLVLHYCPPWRGESPTTPRELCKTAKYKCNIGQTLQYLASTLYLRQQDNRKCRREFKESEKRANDYETCLEKFCIFFRS